MGRSRRPENVGRGRPRARAVLAECALAEILEGARALVAPDVSPLAVELAHSPLGDSTELEAYFGSLPVYGAAENRIVLAGSVADRPLHTLRDLLAAAIEEQCRHALVLLPLDGSLARRVRLTRGSRCARARRRRRRTTSCARLRAGRCSRT